MLRYQRIYQCCICPYDLLHYSLSRYPCIKNTQQKNSLVRVSVVPAKKSHAFISPHEELSRTTVSLCSAQINWAIFFSVKFGFHKTDNYFAPQCKWNSYWIMAIRFRSGVEKVFQFLSKSLSYPQCVSFPHAKQNMTTCSLMT